eukprot:c45425_g1_i1.p1 GENE.c45425_g1_i1~~c45425_g1_i1.p1  ORF type:complete len:154 (-),score=41.89 c45425_g1_i1:78-539(-)
MGKKDKSTSDLNVSMEESTSLDARNYVSVIANPLASDKLTKRCLKLVKKGAKAKLVRRGVKEVVKAIRKETKGIVLLAGNISPIDVISHLPILCEERGIPYIYVPSKEELGQSGLSKRPTSCILLPYSLPGDDEYKSKADEVVKGIKDATPVW